MPRGLGWWRLVLIMAISQVSTEPPNSLPKAWASETPRRIGLAGVVAVATEGVRIRGSHGRGAQERGVMSVWRGGGRGTDGPEGGRGEAWRVLMAVDRVRGEGGRGGLRGGSSGGEVSGRDEADGAARAQMEREDQLQRYYEERAELLRGLRERADQEDEWGCGGGWGEEGEEEGGEFGEQLAAAIEKSGGLQALGTNPLPEEMLDMEDRGSSAEEEDNLYIQ